MTTVVIVGGGISGLLAAKISAENGHDVFLVEKENSLGGLLKSRHHPSGCSFDTGTHFIIPTQNTLLDNLLFEDLPFETCYHFKDSLLEGNYFNEILNEYSGSIDVRSLPKDIFETGLVELLNAPEDIGNYKNLKEKLVSVYGTTFSKHVLEPILASLTGEPLDRLHPSANISFLLQRLIVLSSEPTKEIKKSSLYDKKIAWTKNTDGKSTILKLYPKTGGAGRWVQGLEKRLLQMGVKIITGSAIQSIRIVNSRVRSISLGDNQTVELDKLIWTVPSEFFLKLTGASFNYPAIKFRPVKIIDFIIDKEVITDRHFICCYDPNMVSYRVTLYPNITDTKRQRAPHHLTVEAFCEEVDPPNLAEKIFSELVRMKIIPEDASPIFVNENSIQQGWPIITADYNEDQNVNVELALNMAKNSHFLGRGKTAKSHFTSEVLEHVYEELI